MESYETMIASDNLFINCYGDKVYFQKLLTCKLMVMICMSGYNGTMAPSRVFDMKYCGVYL